jgi:hypothetical protein
MPAKRAYKEANITISPETISPLRRTRFSPKHQCRILYSFPLCAFIRDFPRRVSTYYWACVRSCRHKPCDDCGVSAD